MGRLVSSTHYQTAQRIFDNDKEASVEVSVSSGATSNDQVLHYC